MEEAPTTPTPAPPTNSSTALASITITPPPLPPPLAPPPPPPSSLAQANQPAERDSRRSGSGDGGAAGGGGGRLGLTKEVLSAHTQQEEQAFLDRFKDLSKLRVFDQTTSSNMHCNTPAANPLSRGRSSVHEYRIFTPTDK